jgi:hypothetical protein
MAAVRVVVTSKYGATREIGEALGAIGAHGHEIFTGMILGSVAQRLPQYGAPARAGRPGGRACDGGQQCECARDGGNASGPLDAPDQITTIDTTAK